MKIKDIVASTYFDIDNDEDSPEAIIYSPTVNVFVDSSSLFPQQVDTIIVYDSGYATITYADESSDMYNVDADLPFTIATFKKV